MASHFKIVDGEYIKELKDKSENENMKESKEYWKNLTIKNCDKISLKNMLR